MARIDQAVGAAQARLDRVVSEGRRPELGGGSPSVPAVGRATSPDGGGLEAKAAFDGYLKTGASFGLELKAGLSTASNSAGHVVPEQTERAIERRLMAGSPCFRIRVLDGADEKRTFEVGTDAARYPAADRAVDFPAGLDAESRIAVAQWGDGYGWGREASVALRA